LPSRHDRSPPAVGRRAPKDTQSAACARGGRGTYVASVVRHEHRLADPHAVDVGQRSRRELSRRGLRLQAPPHRDDAPASARQPDPRRARAGLAAHVSPAPHPRSRRGGAPTAAPAGRRAAPWRRLRERAGVPSPVASAARRSITGAGAHPGLRLTTRGAPAPVEFCVAARQSGGRVWRTCGSRVRA